MLREITCDVMRISTMMRVANGFSALLIVVAAVAACNDSGTTPGGALAAGSGGTGTVPGAAGATPSTPAAGTAAPAAGGAGTAGATAGRGLVTGGAGAAAAGMSGAVAGTSGAAGAAAGSGVAGTSGPAAGSGGMPPAAGAPAAGSGAPTMGPTLPAEDDPSTAGAFQVRYVSTAPGLSSHSLFVPSEPGTHGKHPMVVWTCGNGGTVSFYQSFLEHVASHGFFVVADKGSSSDRMAEVASQNDAIEWIIAENGKSGGEYAGKLDVDNIAVMGHSLGSLASFATAAMNEHITTSIHFSGGLTGNPVGFDMSWLAKMSKPAAFLCGANDTTAGPACADDFAKAPPMMPVFYATLARADHIGPFFGARGGDYGTAGVAWLRWQLAHDPAYKSWFSGSGCKLCSSPWMAMQRNLD